MTVLDLLVLFDDSIIDWEGAKVIDRESNKRKRHVKEAIWIRRIRGAINNDADSYELSHLYDAVIKQHQHSPEEVCLQGRRKSLQVNFTLLDVIEELKNFVMEALLI